MSVGGFPTPELTTPAGFVVTAGLLFMIVFLRYLIMSGLYHQLVFRWVGGRYRCRVMHEVPGRHQMLKEIAWSGLTSLIFAVSGVFMLILWERGYTSVYVDPSEYPLWYMPISLILIMSIHETYYYWLHRWMHRPRVYRLFHKVHHDSIRTSSYTSFSFHPVESILQAIINHAAIEVYPKNFQRNLVGKWFIGSAHHDLLHKKFLCNYGLYFRFWDRWMKTESLAFERHFDVKTGVLAEQPEPSVARSASAR